MSLNTSVKISVHMPEAYAIAEESMNGEKRINN